MKDFMSEFKREERYVVFKVTDAIKYLNDSERETLDMIHARMSLGRAIAGKPELTVVVVESDWPEYEGVWKSIEARCAKA
jgi:hypothetical protein